MIAKGDENLSLIFLFNRDVVLLIVLNRIIPNVVASTIVY